MQKLKVNYIFRKRGEGHNSIEELFQSIIAHLPEEIEAKVVELPYAGASLKAVIGNLWHVLFLKGIIHVTGDVYYIGLIPFKRIILTVHDTNVLELSYLPALKKIVIKWFWYKLPIVISKKITVISNFTKSQVLALWSYAANKVKVIYNPVNPLLVRTDKPNINQIPNILHIGTKPHKNLELTIKALALCNYQLTIVGKLNEKQTHTLKAASINYNNVTKADFNHIKQLYEACDLVSFVSFLEGFGMPVIEAQQVGRPVVASNRCSIPEIGGDGVVYVEPDDVEAIAAAYKKIVEDDSFRRQLIDLGYNNVKKFNIHVVTAEYCKLYKELSGYES